MWGRPNMISPYGFFSGFLAALYFTSGNILLINLDVTYLILIRGTKNKNETDESESKRTFNK